MPNRALIGVCVVLLCALVVQWRWTEARLAEREAQIQKLTRDKELAEQRTREFRELYISASARAASNPPPQMAKQVKTDKLRK